MSNTIPFFDTYIDPSSFSLIQQTLKSTFISEGKITAEFEERLRNTGLSHPICVNSGTSALHLALILAGVEKDDEVIIPAQTFIATGLAVLYQKAKPIFADIEYTTGNIDPEAIKKKITKKTKAILPVHWAGYPVDLQPILSIAKEYNLTVIEDAAQALG
ncbi:MAG: aminotransferase class I/II-fold pyridoxal phosphate-dependent enzyme, partial [Candidatus Levybacteria bacterium]|nr:aminotransferase class I/II-fold pyridoxal phosphate-dependent enzyme [Candidatus Levybacteria bacterium]